MDRKQGIIRLGRSKSPRRLQNSSNSFHLKTQSFVSSRNQRDKQPFQQTQNFSKTFNEKNLRMAKSDVFQGAQTHSGFFPPSPDKVLQRVIVRESIRSPVNNQFLVQSPGKTVVVGRVVTNQNSPRFIKTPISIVSDKEVQLERRVKVLEGRIKELHNEKQVLVVQSHQENKRLYSDNQMLQGKIAQVEQINNQQIFVLRQQNQRLRTTAIKIDQINHIEAKSRFMTASQTSEPQIYQKSNSDKQKQPKNSAYCDDDEDVTSINNLKSINSNPMEDKVKELEIQNVQLRENLQEMKQAILQTSAIIEENNQKIIEDYESRVQSLLEELDYCRNQIQENSGLKKKIELSEKTCENYASKLLEKSSDLTKKELECNELKKSLNEAFSLIQQSSEPILIDYEDQQSRVLSQDKSLAIKIQECQKLRKQLELIESTQPQISLDEIDSLTEMMQNLSQQVQDRDKKLLIAETRVKQLESQIENRSQLTYSQQSCTKCQSLMTAFTKLKSKTYARTV